MRWLTSNMIANRDMFMTQTCLTTVLHHLADGASPERPVDPLPHRAQTADTSRWFLRAEELTANGERKGKC